MGVAPQDAVLRTKKLVGKLMVIELPLPQLLAGRLVAVVNENVADVPVVLAMRLAQAIIMLAAVTWPLAAGIPPEVPQFCASCGVLTDMPTTLVGVAVPIVKPHRVIATFDDAATAADAAMVNDTPPGVLTVAVRNPGEVVKIVGATESIRKLVGKPMVTLSPVLRALCKEKDTATFLFVADAMRSEAAIVITTLET